MADNAPSQTLESQLSVRRDESSVDTLLDSSGSWRGGTGTSAQMLAIIEPNVADK